MPARLSLEPWTRSGRGSRGLLLGAGCSLAICACDQPRPRCSIAQGDFAATYTLVSGEGDCATLRGEVLGVQAYYAKTSDRNPRPDYEHASIGIQPQSITDLLGGTGGCGEPDPSDAPYSFGGFASAEPGADDFCIVPTLSSARLRLPAIAGQVNACMCVPARPAVDVSYEWSNVRVYTTAAAHGTQLAGDLRYTKDGCTATYRVQAVYPAVACGALVEPPAESDGGAAEEDAAADEGGLPDVADGGADFDAGLGGDGGLDASTEPEADEGGASADDAPAEDDAACSPPEDEPAPMVMPDDTACLQTADPAHGRAIGSGISDAFAVRCDPDLLLCVLSGEPPSLR